MARLEFFVVSNSVAIDQTTNSASVFEILEATMTPGFPLIIPRCVAMSLWRREAGDEGLDFQLLLRVTTPDGEIHELPSNFRMSEARHRMMQRIQGLTLRAAGELRFEVILNGKHAADHIVDISLIEPPGTQDRPD